ncbi:hypothetical protein [Tannerella forsythia]|nr:hypothetical protein [Tannerella forsythia]
MAPSVIFDQPYGRLYVGRTNVRLPVFARHVTAEIPIIKPSDNDH